MIKRKYIFDRLIAFIVVTIVPIVNSFYLYPLIYISDCTSSISIAASLAGYNFSEVINHAGYYGIGYLWIFFPLFMLGVNPILIYRIVGFVSAMVLGLSTIVIYDIVLDFFPMINAKKRLCISILCGSLSIFSVFNFSMRNEEILLLCSWLETYFLIAIIEGKNKGHDDKKSVKNEIRLLVVMLYSLTLHTRAVVIFVALVIFFVLKFVLTVFINKEKPRLIMHWWFYSVYCLGFIAIRNVLKIYQNSIWREKSWNSSISDAVSSSVSKISFNITTIKGFVLICLGIVHTQLALSLGILLLAFLIVILEINKKNSSLINVGIVFIIAWGSLIIGQGITWLSDVYLGLQDDLKWTRGYRAFTYSRYSGVYAPVVVFCGIMLFLENPAIMRKASQVGTVVFLILTGCWIKFLLPYMNTRSQYYLITAMLNDDKDVGIGEWYGNILITLTVFIVLVVCAKKREMLLYMTLLASIQTLILRSMIFTNFSSPAEHLNYSKADAGFNILSKAKSEMSGIENKDIYVYETKETGECIWYIYQYLNYDYHIIPVLSLDEFSEEEFILFSDGIVDFPFEDVDCYQIDDNEYVYCNSNRYMGILKDVGSIINE